MYRYLTFSTQFILHIKQCLCPSSRRNDAVGFQRLEMKLAKKTSHGKSAAWLGIFSGEGGVTDNFPKKERANIGISIVTVGR